MTDPTPKDNEVALSYERNFELLEAARREYGEAVVSLLVDVNERLRARLADLAFNPAPEVTTSITGEGFLSSLCLELWSVGRPTGLKVFVRPAKPWGGSPACTQVVAVFARNERLTSQTVDGLRRDIFGEDPVNLESSPRLEPDWLFSVELNTGSPDENVREIASLVGKLRPLASRIGEDSTFILGMNKSLEGIADRLRAIPHFNGASKITSKTDWWCGMHCIEFFCPNRPRFWIGYHVANGTLMYGHHPASDSSFANQFFSTVGATLPNRYDRYSSGTILDQVVLRATPTQGLEDLGVRIFELYYSLSEALDPTEANILSGPDSDPSLP